MNDVDLFDGIPTSDAPDNNSTEATADATTPVVDAEVSEADSADDTEVEDAPIETVSEVPEDGISVTAFAAEMTQHLMKAKILAGEELAGDEYVQAGSVYQTVNAKKNRIPHVLVKTEGETEARVYILKTQAMDWWLNRRDKLSTRGSGTASASSRTPESNKALLFAAVERWLYATDRKVMWTDREDAASKLVVKYKGFLTDADVSTDDIDLTIQEATDAYNKAKAEKEAERAKNNKKTGKADANAEA